MSSWLMLPLVSAQFFSLSLAYTNDLVLEPLEIVSATPSQDISSHKVGENFTIECNVGTCYTDLAVSFFKGGDVLKTIRTAKNIGLYQHTFTLDKNSAGVYGCKVDTAEKALFPRMFTLTGILYTWCVCALCSNLVPSHRNSYHHMI